MDLANSGARWTRLSCARHSRRAWTTSTATLDIAPHRAGEFLDEVLARLDGDVAALHEVRTRSALAQLVEAGS